MEARANIIAESKSDFLYHLQEEVYKVLFDITKDSVDFSITVKTKDIIPELIANYIDYNFRRADGQYTYRGEFVSRREIEDKLFEFSKEVSIIIN